MLAAVRRLPELARRHVSRKPLLPEEIDVSLVTAAWKRPVFANPDLPQGAVDRDAYVVSVLEALFRALQVRDVFAASSLRWADPRAHLLDGQAWEAISEDALRARGVPVKDEDVARLSPLGHAHLNVRGRYAISSSAPAEGLRRLGEIPDLPDGAGGVDEEGV